jgi:hypothetical protein
MTPVPARFPKKPSKFYFQISCKPTWILAIPFRKKENFSDILRGSPFTPSSGNPPGRKKPPQFLICSFFHVKNCNFKIVNMDKVR